MNILYIIGDSLEMNSSTMSYKKIILNELLKSNHQVTVVQYAYNTLAPYSEVNKKKLKIISGSAYYYIIDTFKMKFESKYRINMKINKKKWSKNYPEGFSKRLVKKLKGEYDLVLSVSHPGFSHRLAYDLVSSDISYNRWNQVWFETWYDSFNFSQKSSYLIKDEAKLLDLADNIFYSSDLLLEDHSKMYPKYRNKMEVFDLPSYPKKTINNKSLNFTIGYFGSYNSNVRNIIPLYKALKQEKFNSLIIGNSNLQLKGTNNLKIISERISEKETLEYENNMSVLIVLSNWFADIIPGKLYKYAAWDKPILIILDGSERLKKYLVSRFGKFDKVFFANNDQEDISYKLNILKSKYNKISYEPIKDFEPSKIVKQLLK